MIQQEKRVVIGDEDRQGRLAEEASSRVVYGVPVGGGRPVGHSWPSQNREGGEALNR